MLELRKESGWRFLAASISYQFIVNKKGGTNLLDPVLLQKIAAWKSSPLKLFLYIYVVFWSSCHSPGVEPGHAEPSLQLSKRTCSPVTVQEPRDGCDADRGGTDQPHLLLRRRWNDEDEDPSQPLQRCEQQPQRPQERRQILHLDGRMLHLGCSAEECEAHLVMEQSSHLCCGEWRHTWSEEWLQ